MFWPDCPYPVYLGTNSGSYADSRVRMIQVGPDLSWGDTALTMLAAIPTPYVLWFLDDFLIHAPISTSRVAGLFEEMKGLNAEHLRLRPVPPPDEPVVGRPHLGHYRSGSTYRLALEIAFWKRDVLMNLIQPGENPWQMEKLGSRRSDSYEGFYATRQETIQRLNGLERGKWLRANAAWLERMKIAIPPGHPVMTRQEHLRYYLHFQVFRLLFPVKRALQSLWRK
jgi:hypothetical protein